MSSQNTVSWNADTTAQIAQLLSEALIGEVIPPPFGALVIGLIFPSGGLPSYFDQVYAQISKIVNQAVTANAIAIIDGNVNGTQQYIRNTYTPLKNDPKTTAQQKLDAITPYVDDLYENVVATLQQDAFAQPGFPVFLVAASVHLALLQEQAYVDPNHQGTPSSSPYAKAVSNNAQGYAAFAAQTWPKIKQARRDCIVVVQPSSWGDTRKETTAYPPVHETCWRWEDTLTNEHGPNHVAYTDPAPAMQAAAEAEVPGRQNDVVSWLDGTLGQVNSIIGTWNQLVTTPLPAKT